MTKITILVDCEAVIDKASERDLDGLRMLRSVEDEKRPDQKGRPGSDGKRGTIATVGFIAEETVEIRDDVAKRLIANGLAALWTAPAKLARPTEGPTEPAD